MATQPNPYPVRLNIDYPDRQLNRMSSFFRIITVIPIFVLLGLLAGGTFKSWGEDSNGSMFFTSIAGGGLFFAIILLLLFRQKYPKWVFDWNLALSSFSYRVYAYMALMRDEYPSVDEEQAVHYQMDYPDAKQLNRWLPLVKWFLAFPHYIILVFLFLIAFILIVVAWFAILFTGRYPKGIFNFVLGVERWCARVMGYAFLLVTDKYPPFSLD